MVEENKIYTIEYPFCRDKANVWDEEGYGEIDTWRPGIRHVEDDEGLWPEADAMGEMILSVVSIHRPGKFPTRIFYTRKWRTPDGKIFGKKKLLITTQQAFSRLLNGYRHKYDLAI